MQTLSPVTSFSRQLLSQDIEPFQPLRDITSKERNKENQAMPTKKLKRTRLLLDARTELTDEELKVLFSFHSSCVTDSEILDCKGEIYAVTEASETGVATKKAREGKWPSD